MIFRKCATSNCNLRLKKNVNIKFIEDGVDCGEKWQVEIYRIE